MRPGFFDRRSGKHHRNLKLIVPELAQAEYLRTYRQPGAMRAGFNFYPANHQDVADNEAFLAQGKLTMPVLCYGGSHGRGRGMWAVESWRRTATDVRGGMAKHCGHWIPEERPEWVVEQLLGFFGEEESRLARS
jgi:pimeloyl-ACP methyl ester carboxylesterase